MSGNDTSKATCGGEAADGPVSFATDRQLKVVTDASGRLWICPVDVDEQGDLEAQGCWRCGDPTRKSARSGHE